MRSAGLRLRVPLLLAVALAAAAVAPTEARSRPASACGRETASPAYVGSVRRALLAGRDLWGDRLLAEPGGPTYASASRYLAPLLYAAGPRGKRVTASRFYYLALAVPFSPYGSRDFALHVADGSQIVTRRVGGPSVTIFVGAGGRERYGSCVRRLGSAELAAGYLPILQTSYTDAGGVRYRQESFASRVPGTKELVSFVHLTADARDSKVGSVVRLVPTTPRLLVSDRLRVHVRPGVHVDVYASWVDGRSRPARLEANADSYAAARRSVVRFWRAQLSRGVTFDVPERRVTDAERALLVQELSMTWRYSVGSSYEELSFAEALGEAEVMAEYGYGDIAKAILRFTLRRLPERFSNFRAGERLAAGALYDRLTGDHAYVQEETPELAAAVARLGRELDVPGRHGLLAPEAISTDVGTKAFGLHEQTAAWQGLATMGAVWRRTGHPALATRAEALAARLGRALRAAVRSSERRLPDGSLFVPLALLARSRPFGRLTASRDGTYWNLLAPYALATGFFPPHGGEARGALRYLLAHGSLLLGLVRGADYKLYPRPVYPVSGTDEVYGLSVSRFLADEDQPDRLVLALYDMLADSMTRGTYVSGEGATVWPLHGERYRTMLLPPNSAADAAFLETLRLMLVHETLGPDGAPSGLQLAFATPRGWLAPGRTIRVGRAPTDFGPVSYTIRRLPREVVASLDVPPTPSLQLRLRLPAGTRVVAVRIGGRAVRFGASSATIDLTGRRGRLRIEAAVSRGGGS